MKVIRNEIATFRNMRPEQKDKVEPLASILLRGIN